MQGFDSRYTADWFEPSGLMPGTLVAPGIRDNVLRSSLFVVASSPTCPTIVKAPMNKRLSLMIDSLESGGAEHVLVATAPSLAQLGWDVIVDVLIDRCDPSLVERLETAGVPFRVHGVSRLASPAGWRVIDRRLGEGVALVHAHLEFACIIGCTLARRRHIPSVTTQHVFTSEMSGRAGARTRIEHQASRAFAASTVAVSAAGREHLLHNHRYRPEAVTVIPNGVDQGRFRASDRDRREAARQEIDIPDGSRVLMTASVLRSGKGIQHLIAVLPSIVDAAPDTTVVIVGDGPYAANLHALVAESPVGHHVRFLGMRHDLEDLLPAADIFVHPTLGDVLPTAIMEAMAVGLPVVASDTGGVPELVRHGETGLLVEPGDREALADALISLLIDRSRRERFAAKGRSHIDAGFTLTHQVRSLDALYRRVLNGT